MTEPVHTVHNVLWDRLNAAAPADVCFRSGASFDPVSRSYSVRFLNRVYHMKIQGRSVCRVDAPASLSDSSSELAVALLTYMLAAQPVELTRKLVAPSELRGGGTFFRSHGLPVDAVRDRYARDPGEFVSAGLALGATPERYGDASLRFSVLERFPVVIVLWAADDEYPARCSVLFDASADQMMPLDAIYGMVTELCRLLTG